VVTILGLLALCTFLGFCLGCAAGIHAERHWNDL
jgi:hypothetical protein